MSTTVFLCRMVSLKDVTFANNQLAHVMCEAR